MQIVQCNSKEEARQSAVGKFNELLGGFGDQSILLLLSGGSALELVNGISAHVLSEKITVGVLDERYSIDPKENNFAQLASTSFCQKAQDKGAHFIDTRVEHKETLEELAHRFELFLKTWKRAHPFGKVLITQGMGPDGHTAGIMPYPEDRKKFENLFGRQDRWVVGYNATKEKNDYPLRITVTIPFLCNRVDASILYVVGESKKHALGLVLADEGKIWQVPGRIIHEMKHLILYTDVIF
ncbi:MAG: 6-phosphogluconolactonase [Candidatus Wildermuthbacteria bacterium]|nr:6-phosphogluconolactonase [Candidatus Wildermuthbacteria bacterium]